jgi:hypothetical protein
MASHLRIFHGSDFISMQQLSDLSDSFLLQGF